MVCFCLYLYPLGVMSGTMMTVFVGLLHPFLWWFFVDNPHQGNLILYTTDVKLAEVKESGTGISAG